MAEQQSLISGEVMKFDQLQLSEHVQVELGKLNINSYLFKEYMQSLEPFLNEDESGVDDEAGVDFQLARFFAVFHD